MHSTAFIANCNVGHFALPIRILISVFVKFLCIHQIFKIQVCNCTVLANTVSSLCRLIPAKFVRDWKLLFLRGLPLYEGDTPSEQKNEEEEEQRKLSTSSSGSGSASGDTPSDVLDEADLNEYLVSRVILCFCLQ